MTRFGCTSFDDEVSLDWSDATDNSSNNEDEDDYPHPIGFGSRTRYALNDDDWSLDEEEKAQLVALQSLNLEIQSYRYAASNSMENKRILQECLVRRMQERDIEDAANNNNNNNNEMECIAELVRFAEDDDDDVWREGEKFRKEFISTQISYVNQQSTWTEATERRNKEIDLEIKRERERSEQERREDLEELRLLVLQDADRAKSISEKHIQAQRTLEKEDADARQAKAEEEKRRAKEEEIAKEKELQQKLEKEKQQRVEAERAAAILEEEAKEIEHVLRGEKLVLELDSIRAKIAPFEKSKLVSKRRLQIKKIVRGKLNTLSNDAQKVMEVVREITSAILVAKDEDEQARRENASAPESSQGFMYFLDLLASNVIIRSSAETFNSTNGEGFPLANAIALIAAEVKELSPLIMAHVYKVCPAAIPRAPSVGTDTSEDELMDSLGMIKDKSGGYETFDRFLNRTEGLISVSAAMMCSVGDHDIMGGKDGALKWLQNFMKTLPEENTLAVTTAPVLTSFLTAAGHMLANQFPQQFTSILTSIESDILLRLDQTTIGAPAATRLKKVLKEGINGFKSNAPKGFIAELYNNGSSSSALTQADSPSQKNNNAFGFTTEASAISNPFGTQRSENTSGKIPFGGGTSFGQKNNQAQTPFVSSTKPAFGSLGMNSASSNSFSGQNLSFNTSAASPFGGGGSSFGQNNKQAPSPFGNNAMGTFPSSQTNTGSGSVKQGQSSPFVSGNQSNSSNSFGGIRQGQPQNPFGNTSPFGGGVPAHSPFNSQQSNNPFGGGVTQSPFGTSGQAGSNPFGDSKNMKSKSKPKNGVNLSRRNTNAVPPCKYFAQGNCRYGDNCKFSHAKGGNNQGLSNRQNSNKNPFGTWR